MNIKQLRRPFDIYSKNLGRFFPSTGAGSMLELLWKCGEHPVSTQELRQWRQGNRSSTTKVLAKLCKAGVAQHTDSSHTKVEITDHGRQVLADLAQAMRAATERHRRPKTSAKQQPKSELPLKRPSRSVPGRRHHDNDDGQLPLMSASTDGR